MKLLTGKNSLLKFTSSSTTFSLELEQRWIWSCFVCSLQWTSNIFWGHCRTGTSETSASRNCYPTSIEARGTSSIEAHACGLRFSGQALRFVYSKLHRYTNDHWILPRSALHRPEGSSPRDAFVWSPWEWKDHVGELPWQMLLCKILQGVYICGPYYIQKLNSRCLSSSIALLLLLSVLLPGQSSRKGVRLYLLQHQRFYPDL